MEKFIENLTEELDSKIRTLEFEEPALLAKAQKATLIYDSGMKELRNFILSYQFKNAKEEIHFFKDLKPSLYSKLIYYAKLCDIECRRPVGDMATIQQFFLDEIKHFQRFFTKNSTLYQYLRLNKTDLDEQWFRRNGCEPLYYYDHFQFEENPGFRTPCCFKVAKMIANKKLIKYLSLESVLLEQNSKADNENPSILHWTGKKVALVELIYGIYASGYVNNGQANIKSIATYAEQFFNISLGDHSRTFIDISSRANRTQFIDLMKNNLLKKMEEIDLK